MAVLRPGFPDHASAFSREQERRLKADAIVSAAAKRFSTQGFADTRLEDVASDLGLTKTSVSYYFASKEDLAEHVYRDAAAFLHEALSSARAACNGLDPDLPAIIRAFAGQWVDIAARRRPWVCTVIDLDPLSEDARRPIAEHFAASVEAVDAAVRRWAQSADIALGRTEPATFFIFALLDWRGPYLAAGGPARAASLWAEIDSLLHTGLSARPARPPVALRANDERGAPPEIFDREARNRMKREAFLSAGARLFNRRGFSGIGLGEIAESLGVTRGAFYYHFPDKESLLEACAERTWQVILAAFNKSEALGLDGLDALEHALLDIVWGQAAGTSRLIRPGLVSVLPDAAQRRIRTLVQRARRRIGACLSAAIDDGQTPDCDTRTVEDILVGTAFLHRGYAVAAASAVRVWRIGENPHAAARDYYAILMNGLDR